MLNITGNGDSCLTTCHELVGLLIPEMENKLPIMSTSTQAIQTKLQTNKHTSVFMNSQKFDTRRQH